MKKKNGSKKGRREKRNVNQKTAERKAWTIAAPGACAPLLQRGREMSGEKSTQSRQPSIYDISKRYGCITSCCWHMAKTT